MSKPHIVTKEIPLNQLLPDRDQPRRSPSGVEKLGVKEDDEDNRLLSSLRNIGQRSPLAVVKIGENQYKIINGHRRYKCATILGWESLRCEIHPETDDGELKRVRFNIQTNERPWKPLERSRELQEIKKSKHFSSNKELAAYLHYPEAPLSAALTLQRLREKYQPLMEEFELPETYQVEFMKLQPKIRPIKEFSVDDIYRNIFTRAKHQIIRSAKDFRKLSSVFLRANANEEAIYQFLKDPDMTIEPLYEKTERSGYIRDLEHLMKQTDVKSKTKNFTHEEWDRVKAFVEYLVPILKERPNQSNLIKEKLPDNMKKSV